MDILRKIGNSSYAFYCPGCKCGHVFVTPRWTFNDDMDKPTFTPSLRNFYYDSEKNAEVTVCHLNLIKGQLAFFSDCEHELSGLMVPMVEFPENYHTD